jgi:signal transduction histidine kinase
MAMSIGRGLLLAVVVLLAQGSGAMAATGIEPGTFPVTLLLAMAASAVGGLVLGGVLLRNRHAPAEDEPLRSQAESLAELSHAVRTPLNSVIGFSEIMQGEMFGPLGNQRYRDYAGHIQEDAKVLLARVDDLIRKAEMTTRRAA